MSDLLGLEAASLGPIVIRSPPIYIGGANDEILVPVARRADGWHNAQADPAPYEELRVVRGGRSHLTQKQPTEAGE